MIIKPDFEPVEIEGQVVYVYKWMRWLAINKNGDLYGFGSKPTLYGNIWFDSTSYSQIAEVELRGADWTDCLYEIVEV